MFTFNTPKSLVFGEGSAATLAQVLGGQLGNRVFIVSDRGVVAAGLLVGALASLKTAGLAVSLFDGVVADPPETIIEEATRQALAFEASGILGFGGGSSLDVAKLVAVLAKGEQLKDMYGIGNVRGPRLPLCLVPTTAGTGSEVTPISIVTTGTHEKMGVVSPVLLPDLAVLDPELTYGLPPLVSAATGIDAMVHAIEAYASQNANNNPISKTLALEALRLMGPALEPAVREGNKSARRAMLLGAMLAGQAFANSPVAAVHALAYPLGGHFHLPHGLSNALVLPHVLRFNAETHAERYSMLAAVLFPTIAQLPEGERAHAFAGELAALALRCGLKPRLRDYDIAKDTLPMLAKDAMKQTRLLVNNPRPMAEADALAIYQAAW